MKKAQKEVKAEAMKCWTKELFRKTYGEEPRESVCRFIDSDSDLTWWGEVLDFWEDDEEISAQPVGWMLPLLWKLQKGEVTSIKAVEEMMEKRYPKVLSALKELSEKRYPDKKLRLGQLSYIFSYLKETIGTGDFIRCAGVAFGVPKWVEKTDNQRGHLARPPSGIVSPDGRTKTTAMSIREYYVDEFKKIYER